MAGAASKSDPLRIGILGAARIIEKAIGIPSREAPVRLVAIAARDRRRAEKIAARFGIDNVVDSYEDVVSASEVEVVYNPLVNSLHGPWNRAAIAAGKHVLSEKPFASNAEEARAVHLAAEHSGLSVVEGFHYVCHPVTKRLHDLLESGELGELRHVEVTMMTPPPEADDPRWSFSLAGGALMDLGCYCLHALRMIARLAGGEPQLVRAIGRERRGCASVDEWVTADFAFPNGATGRARCNMAAVARSMTYQLIGSEGSATAMDFVRPDLDDRVLVVTSRGTRTEHLGKRMSYTFQLEALTDQIRRGIPMLTHSGDAVATMQLIDACYHAIGLEARPATDLS